MHGEEDDEEQEHLITCKVLERKKLKAMKRPRPIKALPEPTSNRYINYSILWLTFAASAYKLTFSAPNSLNCLLIWFIFSLLAPPAPGPTIDSLLLPVMVGCTFDAKVAVTTMAASLACRSTWGAAFGTLLTLWSDSTPRFIYACPIVVRWINTVLKFSGTSLDSNERALLSCGIGAFVFLGASELGLPWMILVSALVGFIPCQWSVAKAVTVVRNARKGLDYSQLRFYAQFTYFVYFSTAALSITLLGYSQSVFDVFVSTLCDDYHTVLWWLLCLSVAFTAAFFAPDFDLDSRRKLWHICSVAMFLPTSRRKLTSLALSCALALFLKLELIRAAALPPFGEHLHKSLKIFTDHRDTRGPLVISHIYLLLGVAGPIFAGRGSPAGIICIGLGDTFASQIGRRFGRLRVFGNKSLEGALAFFGVVLVAILLVNSCSLTAAATIAAGTALLEAVSPINDNLVLPMYMLVLERIIL